MIRAHWPAARSGDRVRAVRRVLTRGTVLLGYRADHVIVAIPSSSAG